MISGSGWTSDTPLDLDPTLYSFFPLLFFLSVKGVGHQLHLEFTLQDFPSMNIWHAVYVALSSDIFHLLIEGWLSKIVRPHWSPLLGGAHPLRGQSLLLCLPKSPLEHGSQFACEVFSSPDRLSTLVGYWARGKCTSCKANLYEFIASYKPQLPFLKCPTVLVINHTSPTIKR